MSSDTLCDISPLVEEVLDEIQCDVAGPHEGDIVGMAIFHSCNEELLCSGHWRLSLNVGVPNINSTLERCGHIRCRGCKRTFTDRDSFVRYVAL